MKNRILVLLNLESEFFKIIVTCRNKRVSCAEGGRIFDHPRFYATDIKVKTYVEVTYEKEVDNFALINAIYSMDVAYQIFFKEYAGYRKFKN